MKPLFVLLSMLITVVVLDFLWLGIIAKSFYQKELGPLLRTSPQWYAAIFVYLLLIVGIYLFVLQATPAHHTTHLLLYGFLFGVIVYGVYEFTNLTLIKTWSLKVLIVDTLWGGFLCAVVSYVGSRFLTY